MTRDARVFRKVARSCGTVRIGQSTEIKPGDFYIRLPVKAWARSRAAMPGEFGRLARAWIDGKRRSRRARAAAGT